MVAVHLAVYDLSQGMAAMMSQNILGQRIDGIWHSGIRVFGKEWFFGGGVQECQVRPFSSLSSIYVYYPIMMTMILTQPFPTLSLANGLSPALTIDRHVRA